MGSGLPRRARAAGQTAGLLGGIEVVLAVVRDGELAGASGAEVRGPRRGRTSCPPWIFSCSS